MKKIEVWQEDKEVYFLIDGFSLRRADKYEFGIHETIYSNGDIELSYSWEKRTRAWMDNNNLFWIFKDDERIGGVSITPNRLGGFFIEAPYLVDRFTVLRVLNNAIYKWANSGEGIIAYGVLPKDVENFHKLGYRIKCERRVMIRPTEIFDSINWGEDFYIKMPTIEDAADIGKLFYECYSNGIDYEVFGQQTLEEASSNAEKILKIYKSNNILDGSVLVYDRNTNELVAATLAGISGYTDNNFSEIGEIVVKPSYRGTGIAANMIRHALTNLKKISPATILCVTIGNPAEALYHRMGFFSGVKFTNMYFNR